MLPCTRPRKLSHLGKMRPPLGERNEVQRCTGNGVLSKMLTSSELVSVLKTAAESTRLRILALLSGGELNVKDLTRILGQSQPRISRHLKLLAEAGLIERAREGSWAYFRLPAQGQPREAARQAELQLRDLVDKLLAAVNPDDAVFERDRQRAETVKREREEVAQAYFDKQASNWDRIRTLHVQEGQVEARMKATLGDGPFDVFVDLGTGTGRILELCSDVYRNGIGLDLNPAMLAYARSKLDRAGISHAQVRQGDIYSVALPDQCADAVVLHQILHFLSDPGRALAEAARLVAPGGRLLVVDFAPHSLEFLREEFAHHWLGFEQATLAQWLTNAGLSVSQTINLSPADAPDGDRLTVSLWLAERKAEAFPSSLRAPNTAFERTT